MVTSRPKGRSNGIQRRDEILDAALACFVTRGVLAVGIEDIRKAAGASPSSIYHQFSGITDIVVALVERTSAAQYAALAEAAQAASSAEAAVRATVDAQLAWTFSHAREARFMYQAFAAELAGPDRKRLEAVKRDSRAALDVAFAPWLAGTPLATWSALELGVLLLGATHQACRLFLAGHSIDPAWMRTALPELAWRGFASYFAPKPAAPKPAAPKPAVPKPVSKRPASAARARRRSR